MGAIPHWAAQIGHVGIHNGLGSPGLPHFSQPLEVVRRDAAFRNTGLLWGESRFESNFVSTHCFHSIYTYISRMLGHPVRVLIPTPYTIS